MLSQSVAWFLHDIRMSMLTVYFLVQPELMYLPVECFPLTYVLNGFGTSYCWALTNQIYCTLFIFTFSLTQ